jgi:hypothetical protein
MPGITRVKTWVAREVLVYSDLNDEFDNIINNLDAANVDGYSDSVAQMRETTDPGGVGSESLALRISDEIERLRFVISRIVGKTYWYEAPNRSLQSTYLDASLYQQLTPYNQTLSVADLAAEAIQAGFIDSDNFDDNNWLDTTNKKMSDTAFAFKNDPTDSRYFFIDTARTSSTSATFSFWFRNFAANDTIYLNLLSGLHIYLDSNGYLKLTQETSDSVTNGTKVSHSIVGTSSVAGSNTFKNVIVRYKYTNSISDQIDLFLDGTLVGSITNTILPVNFPVAPDNKSVIFANRSPNVPSELLTFPTGGVPGSYSWTKTNTGLMSENATAGVLTLTGNLAADTLYYTKATAAGALPTDGQFIEMKMKYGANITSPTDGAVVGAPFGFYLHNKSSNLGVFCRILPDEIVFNKPDAGGVDSAQGPVLSIAYNFTQWTHIFFVMKPTITYVFLNGELKGSFTTPTDTTASNEVKFGKLTSSNVAPTVQVEYFYFGTMAGTNPDYYLENATNVQQISDICALRGFITDSAVIASLQLSSPFSLFGKDQRKSRSVINRSYWLGTSIATTASASIGTLADFYSDGITPVKIWVNISFRPSTATAGTYNVMAHLKLARSYDGNAQHVTGLVSSTTDGLTALGQLSNAVTVQMSASTSQEQMIPISTALMLPAGKYTMTGVVNNLTSAATIVVNKARCWVSN